MFNFRTMEGIRINETATRQGCKKCGYAGHFTFECHNFVRLDSAKELTLDISSCSSDSDSDTPLQALRK